MNLRLLLELSTLFTSARFVYKKRYMNVTGVPSVALVEKSFHPLHAEERPQRLAWVDNLRTFTIILVVNMHACVTYSHVGSWYIKLPPEPSFLAKIPFIIWQGHLQSFFMGLLFFIGGYFAEKSLARKTPGLFIRDRIVRLGFPSLLFMLILNPITQSLLPGMPRIGDPDKFAQFYSNYMLTGSFLRGSGPLWFALALLAFSVVFALLRRKPNPTTETAPPAPREILLFLGLIILSTFLVRLVQPMGASFYNFQLSFFSQYIAWFIAGIAAARHTWLSSLASSTRAKRAGLSALIGGPLLLTAILLLGGEPWGHPNQYEGGYRWQAFALVAWEQLAGTGLALGMLYWFSRKINVEDRISRWAADRSFAVYVLHTPVLVALALAFKRFGFDPFLGASLLTVSGVILSFALADLARRFPGLGEIL